MWRVLILFGVIAALSGVTIWLADHPGSLVIVWRGYEIRTSFIAGLFAVSFAGFLALLVYRLFATFVKSPAGFTSFLAARKRRKGYQALSRSMVAIAAGDAREADLYAGQAHRLLDEPAMTLLLAAQAAQLRGDAAGATRFFEEMRDHDETAFLGLRGLFVQADRAGDAVAAKTYAEQAFALRPYTDWAADAAFSRQVASGDFKAATATLDKMLQIKLLTRDVARRRRAVLLTAEAMRLSETGEGDAVSLAVEAAELEPEFAPSVALAAKLLGEKGDIRQAGRLIERAWATSPHPDLADVYLTLIPGELPFDRLRRVKGLAARRPGAGESQMALARAALAAEDYETARAELQPLAEGAPTVRVCELMAALETAHPSATDAVQYWLMRALSAPADPCWVAEGYQSESWVAIVPATGRFDALNWQLPPARQGVRPALIPVAPPQEAAPEEVPPAQPVLSAKGTDGPDERRPADSAPSRAMLSERMVVAPDDPGIEEPGPDAADKGSNKKWLGGS